jgi:type VI secretion system protein VasG
MGVNLRSLIGKLNHETRGAIESAAGLCLSRTHYDVEIEHYMMKLLDVNDGDLTFILKHYGIDRPRLARDLTASLDKLKTGNARTPALSPSIVKMMQEAWNIGSLDFGDNQIRSAYTILALVTNEELTRMVRGSSKEFEKINADDLKKEMNNIVGASIEESSSAPADASGGGQPRAGGGKTPNLDQYTVNMTERAKGGKMDPVLGRDFEIRQIVDILTRRRQNNPILVGEAGVGKSAVVEGFAMRIAQGGAADPPQRDAALARSRAAAGRRGCEGRVREPA